MAAATSTFPQLDRATSHEMSTGIEPGTCQCDECMAERAADASLNAARTAESTGAQADGDASDIQEARNRRAAEDAQVTPPAAGGAEETPLDEADFTADERKALAAKGHAMADGSYPVTHTGEGPGSVQSAVRAVGRGGADHDAIRKHVIKRAKALGASGQIPDNWNADGSLQESTVTDDGFVGTDARGHFTEASDSPVTKSGGSYEVTLIREGMGNARDRRVYTKQALKEAVNSGVFEGAQAYADHPTPSESVEQPERSIRGIVGHYSKVRYTESGGRGELRAKFTPVDGPAYQWVRDLIEASLKADKPLLGISINGSGSTEPFTYADGKPAHRVTSIAEVDSVDLVTKAGAGGTFVRKLAESMKRALRAPHQHTEVEMQQRIAAIVARLREAEPESVASALADLEKLQYESAPDDKLTEAKAKVTELETELTDTKAKMAEAEAKVAVYERTELVEKVLGESSLSDGMRESVREQLAQSPTEEHMRSTIKTIEALESRLAEAAPLGAGMRTRADGERTFESLGIPMKAEA